MMRDTIQLLHDIGRLKGILRAGWVKKDIPNPESVADHSYRTAMIVLLFAATEGLDVKKCLKMALIHDIGESKIDDITPHDMARREKQKKEQAAVQEILKDHSDLLAIWMEYEEDKTPEARYVHQADVFEMVLQAAEYEDQGNDGLGEFWNFAEDRLGGSPFYEMLKTLQLQRKRR